VQAKDSILALLLAEDERTGLEERPQVLIGHDTLALEVGEGIDGLLEFLREKLVKKLSVLELAACFVPTVSGCRFLLELLDRDVKVGPAVDDWLEATGELQALQADSDSWVARQNLFQEFFEQRALNDDGMDGEHLLRVIVARKSNCVSMRPLM